MENNSKKIKEFMLRHLTQGIPSGHNAFSAFPILLRQIQAADFPPDDIFSAVAEILDEASESQRKDIVVTADRYSNGGCVTWLEYQADPQERIAWSITQGIMLFILGKEDKRNAKP